MLRIKRGLGLFLALTFVLSLFTVFSGTAIAATTDPYLTEDPGNPQIVFTYVIGSGQDNEFWLTATPATVSGGLFGPTWFDSYDDAMDVVWDINGPGIYKYPAPLFQDAYEVNPGEWASIAYFSIGFYYDANLNPVSGVEPDLGPTNITATNPNSNPANSVMNYTVSANEDPAVYTEADNVIVWVKDPASGSVLTGSGTVDASAYTPLYYRSYPTPLDAAYSALVSGVVATGTYASPGGSDLLSKMTVNAVEYGSTMDTGWLYKVYRDHDFDGTYDLVPSSEYFGADDFLLQDGDLVYWMFDNYDLDHPQYPFPSYVIP